MEKSKIKITKTVALAVPLGVSINNSNNQHSRRKDGSIILSVSDKCPGIIVNYHIMSLFEPKCVNECKSHIQYDKSTLMSDNLYVCRKTKNTEISLIVSGSNFIILFVIIFTVAR